MKLKKIFHVLTHSDLFFTILDATKFITQYSKKNIKYETSFLPSVDGITYLF
jgi:hypothetical protein